jgi:ABC-type lipoprotein release transport system permease subunit
MNVIASISFRNLVRQKRRNILLGIAIAFGTMILVIANSFSHGISDVVFNRIMKYASGHVSIIFSEKGSMFTSVFRDGDRVIDIVKNNVREMEQFTQAIGVMCRGVGNGKSDNVVLVGVDLSATISKKELEETMQNFNMQSGSFLDLADSIVENPLIISTEKAAYLNVKKGDILRIRYTDINGQNQAARLTIVGLFKPANAFMAMPMFVEMKNVHRLLGYGPHDIAQLYINLKNPKKDAIPTANSLHALLKPGMALIPGTTSQGASVPVLGYRSDTLYLKNLQKAITVVSGDSAAAMKRTGTIIGSALATALSVKAGDTLALAYAPKYGTDSNHVRYPITAVYASRDPALSEDLFLVNEYRFYDDYYYRWPAKAPEAVAKLLPPSTSPVSIALAPEWILLDRCKTTDEVRKRYKEISKRKWRATTVDVQTMYESASDVLKMEAALNLITVAAVMILFFIILIGVVNTLRMTIRERTREIGTVRAIGMQKKDVRNSFILETGLLTLFASAAGTVLAFAVMWLLSLINIKLQDNPISMLLVNGHINFVPSVWGILGYNALIVIISVITAWFPARRAANLAPTAALRHYE